MMGSLLRVLPPHVDNPVELSLMFYWRGQHWLSGCQCLSGGPLVCQGAPGCRLRRLPLWSLKSVIFSCSFLYVCQGGHNQCRHIQCARGSQEQFDLHMLLPTHSVTATGTNDNLVLPFTLMQGADV